MKKAAILFLVLSVLSLNLLAQQRGGTGLVFNDDQYNKTPMKAPLTRSMYGKSLPSSASLKKYAPTPKSQGNYGTCVGWSSTYAGFTIINSIRNNRTDKNDITNHTFSPLFVYRSISQDNSCVTGTYINEALDILKTKGAPDYNDFNFDCVQNIPADLVQKASKNKIQDYAKIFDLYDNNSFKIETTKKSLSENKPVIIGMKAPDSFFDTKDCWTPLEDPEGNFGGHAMCVIGYDDNVHGGAFEIQNSWGTWWGNDGYIWIKYEDYAKFTKYAFELIEKPKTVVNDEVDLSGNVKFILSNGEEMKGSLVNTYYKMNKSYKSGTRFRLYISNNEPAFVYAIGSDLTGKTYQIFPHKENISPALTYKQNDVAIPDETHFIEMDNTVGKDYLCVVYSKEPVDINVIRSQIENLKGDFNSKLSSVFATEMVNPLNLKYNADNTIGFKAKSKGKKLVLLVVETQHVP